MWPLICPWCDSLLNLCGSRFKLLYQYPVSMPDLEAWARSGPGDSCTLACFWTASALPKPDTVSQNWIGARLCFAQYDLGCLWKNATESESRKLVVGQLCSAITESDDSCTLACFQTRCTWPKPDQAIQIGSGIVLHNMIQAFFRKTDPKSDLAYMIWPDPGCMLAIMAITGHNQNASRLDLVCLLDRTCDLSLVWFPSKFVITYPDLDWLFKHSLNERKDQPTSGFDRSTVYCCSKVSSWRVSCEQHRLCPLSVWLLQVNCGKRGLYSMWC